MLPVNVKRQVNVSPMRRGNVGTTVATMTGETSLLSVCKSAGQTFPRSAGETSGNVRSVARSNVSPRVCPIRDTRGTGTHGAPTRPGGAR